MCPIRLINLRTLSIGLLWTGLMLFGLCAATGCHFYQFGNQSLFRPDVQTVYVEMFEADTY